MNEENTEFNKEIIVRFPPSPTGRLHIGNIRSLLFNYLYAKKNNGTIVMRFEDTDRERSKEEFEEFALETLDELGIDFDKGPFKQSKRNEFYIDAIETLLEKGVAFEGEESKDGSGDKVIRIKNPNKKIKFTDAIRGEIEIDTTDFGDFVIARSKTNPLYHLTVVVDDIDMGITDVIRGEDHITSTPRQIILIEALGGIIPKYAHLPLIVGDDKKKLGKRHGAVTWNEFKKDGYLAEGVINYLALLGWNPGDDREFFTKEDLIKEFSLEKINNSPAVFDYKKLDSINRMHMLKLNEEEYRSRVFDFLPEELKEKFSGEIEKTEKIISMIIKERIDKFSDIQEMHKIGEFNYFFEKPKIEKEKLIFKDSTFEKTSEILTKIKNKLDEVEENNFTAENLKEKLWDWTGEIGRGYALHPMRFGLSGLQRSPDPFTISEILGKDETLERLEDLISLCGEK